MLQKLASAYKKVYKDMDFEVKEKNLKPPANLKDYCQWLANFNPSIQGKDLEIPGMGIVNIHILLMYLIEQDYWDDVWITCLVTLNVKVQTCIMCACCW